MKSRFAFLAALLVLITSDLARAEELLDAVVKVYSQTLTFKVHKGWTSGYRAEKGGAFLLELVPPGESVEAWTQMLTIRGFQGLSSKLSAQQAYEAEAQSVVDACPREAVNEIVQKPASLKEEAVYALIGCAKHPSISDRNEIALYAFIKGRTDIYMVKKSFRELLASKTQKLDRKSYKTLAAEVLSVTLLGEK